MLNLLTKKVDEIFETADRILEIREDIRAKFPDYRRAELNPFTGTNSWDSIFKEFADKYFENKEQNLDMLTKFKFFVEDNYNVPTKK